MRIYLLRHEKRDLRDPTFYSPLLPEGLEDADKLKYLLDKLEINVIYASPFKRVLQTIKPYCDMKDLKINIEYGLYEQIFNVLVGDGYVEFDPKNFKLDLKSTDSEFYLKNKDYTSLVPLSKIEFTNKTHKRCQGVFDHLTYLYQKYENMNILLVSHAGILGQMAGAEDYEWPMGGLALAYDDSFCEEYPETNGYKCGPGRVFEPINFELKKFDLDKFRLKL